MFNTISSRELQRTPGKVMKDAQKKNEPIIVISENKPIGAIISLDLLRMLNAVLDRINKLEMVDEETEKNIGLALKDYEEGRYIEVDPTDEKKLNQVLGIT